MPDLDSHVEISSRQAAQTPLERTDYTCDRTLVENLISGEAAAWQEFVEQFGRLVRARVADVARSFGRLTDSAAIDDATAEVFAALLHNDCAALRAFEGRSSLATYLTVISTRCSTRSFAAKRVLLAADQDQEFQELQPTDATEPFEFALAKEQKAALRVLLDRLPEKHRRVVELFHFQNSSYAEISRTLNIPLGSVGTTLKRAEAKLRVLLKEES